jgi:hypothetical protein
MKQHEAIVEAMERAVQLFLVLAPTRWRCSAWLRD